MKRITLLSGFKTNKIETFGLSEEQHNIAVNMAKKNVESLGNYILEVVDADTLDYLIDNAKEKGNTEYENFLAEVQLKDAELYTLTDSFCGIKRTLGEIAIY